ncbi:MAG: molybdate ABC transporter permease subunit [Lentisphaeraceae bacterium]|nr:molybdate ABC transporter permease subunit [Lentisphaeraceae bacterium]
MLSENDTLALFTTLKLAFITTVFLLLIAAPISYWLATSKSKFKVIIEALTSLPLVLPPTVLGFYLLILLGKNGPLGNLAFSFTGLVIGSILYSLPFVIQPLKNSFAAIGSRPLEEAATLGASPLDTFFSVVFPMAKPGFVTAAVLGFAHTVGEFGVVLMIGGNIPGETQVLSIAIYDHVEAGQYSQAHTLSGLLLAFSFVLLVFVFAYNKKKKVLP